MKRCQLRHIQIKAAIFVLKYGFVAFGIFFFTSLSLITALLYWLLTSLFVLAILEILFRLCWRLSHCGQPYVMIRWINSRKMYIEPHPYLPYVYRKWREISVIHDRGWHQEKGYMFYGIKTNSLRISNGKEGDREIVIPKPFGMFRINCLGASTTGMYITHGGRRYSYPLELERILQAKFPHERIEVNNFGIGGYNSADILVRFVLTIQDSEPDIIVIYHAFNDLEVGMTDNFESDYSHYKRNLDGLWENYQKASRLPHLPIKIYNYLASCCYSQVMMIGNNRSLATVKEGVVRCDEFHGIATYKRNLETIIRICLSREIRVVLSTYAHYCPDEEIGDPFTQRLIEGIEVENDTVRYLANEFKLPLVDNARLLPQKQEYFVDMVHFSPTGMQLLADNISVPIKEYIGSRQVALSA